jgi:hypothetical protein
MKALNHSLLLILTTAVDSFSPPRHISRPPSTHVMSLAQQTSSGPKQETEREKRERHKRNQRRWGEKANFRAKPTRPFGELSFEELRALTEYHLSQTAATEKSVNEVTNAVKNDVNGAVTSTPINEVKKLISSWAKLASAGYISTESDVVMLTKKEKLMAAEMAEKCLRRVIDARKGTRDGNKSAASADLYHSVSLCCPFQAFSTVQKQNIQHKSRSNQKHQGYNGLDQSWITF